MKKPSIATTIDEESFSATKPFLKKFDQRLPECVTTEFTEINSTTNWVYLVFGVAYIMECRQNLKEKELLMEKISSKEISLTKCKNIPRCFREENKESKLGEIVRRVVDYAKELVGQGKSWKQQDEEIFNFIQSQPKINFVVPVLIRSICLYHAQDIINENPIQYLGNQLKLIADYSVNPAYKIISLISKIFNYSVKIDDLNQTQLSVSINRSNPAREIVIKKFRDRIFFKIDNLIKQQPIIRKKQITVPFLSAKSIQSPQCKARIHTQQKIQQPKIIQQMILTQMQRKQSVNSLHNQHTERVKICVTCGQSRKPQQKFCECKKRKLNTSKS